MSIRSALFRGPSAGRAHPYLIQLILLAAALSTLAAPRARASHLLVSSGDSVLRYDEATGAFVDSFIPTGSGGLTGSQGLAFGPDGNLYVSSQLSQSVLRFDVRSGAFLGAFVPPGSGGLTLPTGLTFGPDGSLYVASFGTSSILRYDGRTGGFLGAFVSSSSGGLNGPTGLTFGPDGSLYVGNAANNNVLRFDGRTGAFIGPFTPIGSGGQYGPVDPVFGLDANLYVNNYYTHTITRYSGQTGALIDLFVPPASGGLSGPTSLTFGPDGNLYVASADNDSVLRYDGHSGVFEGAFVPSGSGGLSSPAWLAFTPPAPPGSLTATISGARVELAWADNSDDEDAFAIWRMSGIGSFTRIATLPPNSTRFEDSGVSPGSTYTYRVRATHGYYPSAWSNLATATVPIPPPAAPTALSLQVVSSHQLNLTWRDNSSNATAIAVWRQTFGSAGWGAWVRVAVLLPNSTSYADLGLTPGTIYGYRVRATNNVAASAWSNQAVGTTPAH